MIFTGGYGRCFLGQGWINCIPTSCEQGLMILEARRFGEGGGRFGLQMEIPRS